VLFVLDASAMIAYLRDEPGAGRVSEALLDPDGQCIAHVLNLCEVFYDFQRGNSGKLVGKLVGETPGNSSPGNSSGKLVSLNCAIFLRASGCW